MFGEFIKERRLELDLSLREFCKRIKEDPSNWSKIERNISLPPRAEKKLREIAKVLNIKVGSDEWNNLNDFANVDSGNIPEYVMSNEEVLKSLPAFFRTVGSVKPSKEELDQLIKKLKGNS